MATKKNIPERYKIDIPAELLLTPTAKIQAIQLLSSKVKHCIYYADNAEIAMLYVDAISNGRRVFGFVGKGRRFYAAIKRCVDLENIIADHTELDCSKWVLEDIYSVESKRMGYYSAKYPDVGKFFWSYRNGLFQPCTKTGVVLEEPIKLSDPMTYVQCRSLRI